jgi:hypothetical protein
LQNFHRFFEKQIEKGPTLAIARQLCGHQKALLPRLEGTMHLHPGQRT